MFALRQKIFTGVFVGIPLHTRTCTHNIIFADASRCVRVFVLYSIYLPGIIMLRTCKVKNRTKIAAPCNVCENTARCECGGNFGIDIGTGKDARCAAPRCPLGRPHSESGAHTRTATFFGGGGSPRIMIIIAARTIRTYFHDRRPRTHSRTPGTCICTLQYMYIYIYIIIRIISYTHIHA